MGDRDPGLHEWEFEERLRGEDSDALKNFQGQEVSITANDVRGAAAQREFQELVVFWIAAGGDGNIDLNPIGFAHEGGEKPPRVFERNIFSELLSAEDFVKFE